MVASVGQANIRRGGGGSATHEIVYSKWHDQIFPPVNIVLSHDGHFGLEGGAPPAAVVGRSDAENTRRTGLCVARSTSFLGYPQGMDS